MMPKKGRPKIQPEQILVVALHGDGFTIGGDVVEHLPWGLLGTCFLFTLDESSLSRMLSDAVSEGYMILDGTKSDRRGLRAFTVGIGAYGWMGKVDCRIVDQWAIEVNPYEDVLKEAERCQTTLRNLCRRINNEKNPWKPSAVRWLSAVRGRLVLDDEDSASPLPEDVAMFCRRAHVGGPILHTRTTLSPYVHLDRDRAFGTAMLEDLPSGRPAEIAISEKKNLLRWTPRDLMSSYSIIEATVEVFDGPFVPLLPVVRWNSVGSRTVTLFPTGMLRGVFCSAELADLEQSGRGYVKKLHRVIAFEPRPVLAPVIRYLRKIAPDLGSDISSKRLEHMIYGSCSRSLSLQRFASGSSTFSPVVGDLMKPDLVRRLKQGATVKPFALERFSKEERRFDPHRLYEVKGSLRGQATVGYSDRPDRSAWITSMNRVGIQQIVKRLDEILKPARSGDYIGRIYVDGMDIEVPLDKVPSFPDASVRYHGDSLHIYRSGAFYAEVTGDKPHVEATGIQLPEHATREDLELEVKRNRDLSDASAQTNGRFWPVVEGFDDPRMAPNVRSEPLSVDLQLLENLDFFREETPKT